MQPTHRDAAESDQATPFDAANGAAADDDVEGDEEELPEVIDLSDVQAASYEVIPRGRYPAYIDSIEYGLSQTSNAPMLTWIIKLDYEDKERSLRYWTTLTGEGAGRSKATLARLDPELDFAEFRPEDMDERLGGLNVIAVVTVRPDRDDRSIKRNNIADLFPAEDEEEG